jgi:hypothetical protein
MEVGRDPTTSRHASTSWSTMPARAEADASLVPPLQCWVLRPFVRPPNRIAVHGLQAYRFAYQPASWPYGRRCPVAGADGVFPQKRLEAECLVRAKPPSALALGARQTRTRLGQQRPLRGHHGRDADRHQHRQAADQQDRDMSTSGALGRPRRVVYSAH